MNLKQYIDKRPFSIVIFFFVLLYAWQPFFAGVYSDDWGFLLSYFTENAHPSAPFSLDRLTHFMSVYANRPLSGVMYYVVNSICDYNIFWVNALMIIGVFVAIYSFYIFAKELFRFLEFGKPKFVGALASLIWLVSPWTLGVTVWYSSSINLLAIIFFSLSMYFFFKGLNKGRSYFFSVSFCYLLSCLTYESFFFQYLILILVVWLYSKDKGISKKLLLKYLIPLSIIVILVAIWNRIAPMLFSASINKVFNPYFLQTMVVNIVSFPYVIIESFALFDYLMLILTLIIATYIIIKCVKSNFRLTTLVRQKEFNTLILLSLGILAGLVLYSMAGYTFWGLGSRSRTMFVASFYIPLILVVVTNWVYKLENVNFRFIKSMILMAFAVSLLAIFINKLDWVKANELQKDIISKIPKEEFESLDSNATVIVVAPFRSDWISVIDAPWAINYQMNYGHSFYFDDSLSEISKAQFVVGRSLLHPVSGQHYQNYWDGKYLYQGYKLKENASDLTKNFYFTRLDRFKAEKLYVWDYYSGTFKQITKPQLLEFKPFYNYDYWVTWLYNNWVK